ncbi:MAG TPA: anti-sigma factor [Methylomirabilota bacterium]|nr:anti-sigma factor [Methylomirabilota bacterium]
MDHDEVLEQLELAAVEPDGLARLVAGDTAIAAAVAGHLAGCDACAGEFQRLGRAAPLLRDVVRTTPSADLRARTLEFVRVHGVPRGDAQTVPTSLPGRRPRIAGALPWVASIAAAVVLSALATSFIVDQQVSQRLADYDRSVGGLAAVTNATIDLTARPDLERVTLASADADTTGTLLFSPSTTQLVVVATGLQQPPVGREYRCWVEVNGKREPVGRMFFADDLAYWVGDTPAVSGIPQGTTFGVSLAELGGASIDAPPVITGQL